MKSCSLTLSFAPSYENLLTETWFCSMNLIVAPSQEKLIHDTRSCSLNLKVAPPQTIDYASRYSQSSAEKQRLREYLIDALTASNSTGTVLHEITERKNKNGYECPDCESDILFDSVNIQQSLMVKGLKNTAIAVRLVKKHLLTSQIQFFIELVTLASGLNLLSI